VTLDSVASTAAHTLPGGVVTFLFSDIEGSTLLLQRLGDEYADVLRTHHRLMRECFTAHDGVEVDTEGDAFFVAFSSPRNAVTAAAAAQRALHEHTWPHGETLKVRMGLHTGDPLLLDGKYVGIDVHRAARICSSAHGGQVVLSARVLELVGGRLPPGVTVRDLGDHRLKDLPNPEHLLQLEIEGLETSFPPLKALEAPTNVPQFAALLVGRVSERADLHDLLVRPDVRLVTVTGPGGAGKTRLAAAVALELKPQFPFGVFFVDLTHLTQRDDVLLAIGGVLQVSMEGDGELDATIAKAIGDHRMLLVLDNFEQALAGALPLADLLRACPNLHVVATSRVLLDLEDEYEYVLPPLGLPQTRSLADIRSADAVQLFVERARKARHGFELTARNAAAIAEICTLLDGLPLAIELAAARSKLFTPENLLARLGGRLQLLTGGARDMPERHRTLRSTIDWSYNLLGEDERKCFLDLAVFHGGARLESIEAVLGTDTDIDILGAISGLTNHSLVTNREDADGQPRFRMLQTIRDYALELLSADAARFERLRGQHADHFLDALEEISQSETRPDRQRIKQDRDNVRAALGYWLDDHAGDPDAGDKALRLATAMSSFWYQHGESAEGSRWLEQSLAASRNPSTRTHATALRMLGVMCETRQELDRARDLLTEASRLYQGLGDRDGEARCFNSLAIVDRSAGRAEEAEELLRKAIRIREELNDPASAVGSLNNLGILLLDRAAWQEGIEIFTETRRRDEAADDDWGVACSNLNLAVAHLLGSQVDSAAEPLRRALRSFAELEDWDGLIEGLEAATGLATARGDVRSAARLGGAADAARTILGIPGSPIDRVHFTAWIEDVRRQLPADDFEALCQEGRAMTIEQAARYALDEMLS
jgi:predicted ATPase/class 3 adenylate cyclase